MIAKIINKNNKKLLVIDVTDDNVRNDLFHRVNVAHRTIYDSRDADYPMEDDNFTYDIFDVLYEDVKEDYD